MIKDYLQLFKVKHYIKNLVVFVPLIFSLNFKNIKLSLLAGIAFVAFCLISSAVYVFNDIIDKEADKLHPVKKNRLIASGRLSIAGAVLIFISLLCISSVIAFFVNKYVFFVISFYLVLNIFYSLYLKHLPIIDAACIAIGFIFRILAGCFAISVIPSPLVILLTFFTSMLFTFAKRKFEYQMLEGKEGARLSVREYNMPLLNQYIGVNAILSIAFYFTYMLDSETIARAGTSYLYISVIPFSLVIYRLLFLIHTSTTVDDPASLVYGDKTLKLLFMIYLFVIILLLI